MATMKEQIIGAGFAFFKATRLHKGLAPITRGRGAILMLHHVRPFQGEDFAPNRLLEIEPGFLDAALNRVRSLGFDLVSMDEAVQRIDKTGDRPFVALTFDDGYLDLVEHALPVLERHEAPFAAYITTGFADRSARLWWVELEKAIGALDHVAAVANDVPINLPAATPDEKATAFRTLYWILRGGSEERLRNVVSDLAGQAGIKSRDLVERLCLDWDGVRRVARHPLCTIGAHTLTHPMLAKHDATSVRREMTASRQRIETEIGLPIRHFAYPVGDPTSAGPREFTLAAELGFSSAVTTRPGMIFPEHGRSRTALPRLSLNGNWQNLDSLEVLLSGVPFAIWNKGRLVA